MSESRSVKSPPKNGVPILCASCNEVIVVTAAMLDGAYSCAKCGEPIDFTAYEPLAKMLEDRAAAAKEAKRREREEKRTAVEAERARLRLHQEAVREELAREKKERDANKHLQKEINEKVHRARLRIATAWPTFLSIAFFLLGLLIGASGMAVFLAAKAIFQEAVGVLVMLLGSVFFMGGIFISYASEYARDLALKLDAVRDAITDLQQIEREKNKE